MFKGNISFIAILLFCFFASSNALDFEGSYDIVEAFKQSKHYLESSGISDFKILILTNGFWPNYPPVQCNVPVQVGRYGIILFSLFSFILYLSSHSQISTFCNSFEAFYTSKYSGRRFIWQHHLSQLTLKAKFQSVCLSAENVVAHT
jgi:cullin-4